MSDESYTPVTCRLARIEPKSVWITVGSAGREVNVPRTLIHGADETRLDGLLEGTKLDLRIFTWKAQQLGLTGSDGTAAIGDLFGGKR